MIKQPKTLPLLLTLFLTLASCDELQEVVKQLPGDAPPSEWEIQSGLKEALQFGVSRRVEKLGEENGFFDNPLVRIGLPEELEVVDRTLRRLGLSSLADEGIRYLNRAAEDAVVEAIPIFTKAVSGITFADARDILLGADNAATLYLEGRTSSSLFNAFEPVISNSFQKVGADRIWADIIARYNELPLVRKVNPDLSDYITREALKGVYTVIAEEEKEIRSRVSSRSTRLLQRVFALQDEARRDP